MTKERKTLHEWFPDGKPDGRKFELSGDSGPYFIPLCTVPGDDRFFYGIDVSDVCRRYDRYRVPRELYAPPPKQIKKVKLFKPLYKFDTGQYTDDNEDEWHTDKGYFKSSEKIVGWLEIEGEVED